MKNAQLGIGNSSSFIKEAAYFGTPTIIVGDRQHNREHGLNVRFTDYNKDNILAAMFDQMGKRYEPDYRFGNGTASKKIMEVLSAWTPLH